MRAQLAAPTVEAGKVLLPIEAGWRAQFLDELLAFPSGAHDDVVDSFVLGVRHLREAGTGPFLWARVGRANAAGRWNGWG